MFSYISKLEYKDNSLKAVLDADFCRYYRKLFYYETFNTVKCFRARYGDHITIYNKIYHGQIDKAAEFDGQMVEWFYNPTEMYIGGQSKGFVGCYMKIESLDIDRILNILGIEQSLHISLFTNKHFAQYGNPSIQTIS